MSYRKKNTINQFTKYGYPSVQYSTLYEQNNSMKTTL